MRFGALVSIATRGQAHSLGRLGSRCESHLRHHISAPNFIERFKAIDELASNFPNLTIVAAHPGWPWVEEMTAVALHKGNVYWELSGWAPRYFPDGLKRDIRGRLRDKVMFGSDYPSLPYDRIFREWEELRFTDEVLEKVFHLNAERVLGLTDRAAESGRAAG